MGRQGLRGWELMDIALSGSSTVPKEVRLDKETGKLFEQWTKAHPLALTLVGSNLEPQLPAIPVVLDHIRRITVDTKDNETRDNKTRDHHTNLDNGSSQLPDVSTRPVKSRQATASPAHLTTHRIFDINSKSPISIGFDDFRDIMQDIAGASPISMEQD
jgi:hypothetical protein